jgi:hypothetical protein
MNVQARINRHKGENVMSTEVQAIHRHPQLALGSEAVSRDFSGHA